MANNERGEVRLDAGEQSYVLRFSTNAMCDLEDLFGEPFSQIVERLTKPDEISLSDLRKLLWGAIADTVPEWSEPSRDTLRAVGSVADAAGLLVAIQKIAEAVAVAFPEPDAKPGKKPRPMKVA